MLSSGVFRRATASGFYPWGNVVSPRKRGAEGLCGWRHGNSFPMTQNAHSLRQMRSIPHCSKAVFYVFVFDSIHNSATMHNPSTSIYPLNRYEGFGGDNKNNSWNLCNSWLKISHRFAQIFTNYFFIFLNRPISRGSEMEIFTWKW